MDIEAVPPLPDHVLDNLQARAQRDMTADASATRIPVRMLMALLSEVRESRRQAGDHPMTDQQPIAEKDAPRDKREEGLHGKFYVERLTPSARGIDHSGCRYFVLDPEHDPIARAALARYAQVARADGFGPLADDLDDWLTRVLPPGECDHDPLYSRSECVECGQQEAWCDKCHTRLCGCVTPPGGGDTDG